MSEPKSISILQSDVSKTASWRDLFVASSAQIETIRFRVIRKRGEPLLILPDNTSYAAQSLALYPAQSPRARFARCVARWVLSLGVPIVRERIEVNVGAGEPFAQFLCGLAKSDKLPEFAILNGNPRTPGRRFIFLIFDTVGKVTAVIKAGADELARSLILREASFLKSVRRPGIPTIRAECVTDSIAAFAMDFVPGDSPRNVKSSQVASLLSAWLDRERTSSIGELPQWTELQKAAAKNLPESLTSALLNRSVHPVIAHGDFAPWNVKVMPDNSWTVLDWERGELNGIPAWDWFHFVIQPLVLAEKRSPDFIMNRIDTLLGSTEFRTYAEASRIAGFEKPLLQSYLLWLIHVIRPTEGAETMRKLLSTTAVAMQTSPT